MRIVAQCENTEKLFAAIEAFRGAILIAASSLRLDLSASAWPAPGRLAAMSSWLLKTQSRLPKRRQPCSTASSAATSPGLSWWTVSAASPGDSDLCSAPTSPPCRLPIRVGTRVRDRLTPKEMQIVALIVQGCKNKEIATQLGTKEQVIKNYLRTIYDKTGVSDRLELALFTIHHRVLAEAAAKAGNLLQMKTA